MFRRPNLPGVCIFFLATGLPLLTQASPVQVVVNGTITTSTDFSDAFGSGSDLNGKSITLTFTFDNSVSADVIEYCGTTPCGSYLEAFNQPSPGSVLMQVNGLSVSFSNFENIANQLLVAPDLPSLQISADDGSGANTASVFVRPASSAVAWPTDYLWQDPFTYSGPFLDGGLAAFAIDAAKLDAEGNIDVNSIAIGASQAAPEPAVYSLAGFGLLFLGLYRVGREGVRRPLIWPRDRHRKFRQTA